MKIKINEIYYGEPQIIELEEFVHECFKIDEYLGVTETMDESINNIKKIIWEVDRYFV